MVDVLAFDGGFIERVGGAMLVEVVCVVAMKSLHRILSDYGFTRILIIVPALTTHCIYFFS